MDVKLSQTTSNTKKREAEHQDVGLAKFGDVDFDDESASQRNDLGVRSAEEALGSQPTEGDPMNEDNVEASTMFDPPQTEESQKQKETTAPIDDTYPPDRSSLLSFKFHRARSIYLGQEPGCLCVHHHTPTWHLEKEPTIVRDLVMLASLDRISEISYKRYNAGLISGICEH
ncbi:hypothetical protein GIB67_019329 [Kingdonia uniflora]|uniref:Uncharacterized protein n=1 Tax=Kingdonia uniflora TaxID=39325 RepID=A0A7J7M1H6_9MAGN|nr:hypothetical protein GIB67_019329 [Kingdonia uniflora]